MSTFNKAVLPSGILAAGLFLCGSQASASVVTWNIDGTITSVNAPYLAAGWVPSDSQQTASQSALAPFSNGSTFQATLVVDLDSPRTPASGVANFEGSIKSFDFFVPKSGYTYSSSNLSNSGVSITTNSPSGDVIYFYLPTSYSFFGAQADMLASFYFLDPNGNLSSNLDLHELYNTFDSSKYSFMGGSANLSNYQCLYSSCGSLEFSVRNASVSAVPNPATVWLFGAGLIGLFGVAYKRKTS